MATKASNGSASSAGAAHADNSTDCVTLRFGPHNVELPPHQVIGTSQLYTTQSSCDNGIASVQRAAPEATVVVDT